MIKGFSSFVKNAYIAIMVMVLALSAIASPINVHAQSDGQSTILPMCSLTAETLKTDNNGKNGTFLTGCLKQIINFIIVVALLVLAVRIVTVSTGAVLPFSSGTADSTTKTRELISDAIIGILILGGAYLFLSPLNPALNSIDFLNLPPIQ